MLQENSPKGVCHSRKGGEVDEDSHGAEIGNGDPTAEDQADKDQKDAADDELIAAYEHRLLVLREFLHKHGSVYVFHRQKGYRLR